MCVCKSLSQCDSCLFSVLIIASCSSICFACSSIFATILGSGPLMVGVATDVAGESSVESREEVEDASALGALEAADETLPLASPFMCRGAGGGGTEGGGVGGGSFMGGRFDRLRSTGERTVGGEELRTSCACKSRNMVSERVFSVCKVSFSSLTFWSASCISAIMER